MKTHDFKFHNITIRAVEIEGEPWFIAPDVCRVLGLPTEKGAGRHLTRLDAHEKCQMTPSTIGGIKTGQVSAISESGLYKLVMRSKKPEAREFQHWVTSVVLPAIRKDGEYIMGEEKVQTGEMSEEELVLCYQVLWAALFKNSFGTRGGLTP